MCEGEKQLIYSLFIGKMTVSQNKIKYFYETYSNYFLEEEQSPRQEEFVGKKQEDEQMDAKDGSLLCKDSWHMGASLVFHNG